jgi:6-phosphogluconate dehydrogenase
LKENTNVGEKDKKDTVKDRLQEAMENRSQDLTLSDGRKLTVMKWPWRLGLLLSAKMLEAVRSWVVSKNLTEEALMKLPFQDIVKEHSNTLGDVLAETVKNGNFTTKEEAIQFVEALPYDDFVKLVQLVMMQNFVPLREVFSTVMKLVKSAGKQAIPLT